MQATMLKRSNSDIERRLELTKVEREPKGSIINEEPEEPKEPQKQRNDSSSTIEDLEMLEETSDTEDVFQ